MHSGFGSTKKEPVDPMAADLRKLKKEANKTATLRGCSIEIQILKQQIAKQQEQLNSQKNLIMTIRNQFMQFEQQRAIELSGALAGGPTVRE